MSTLFVDGVGLVLQIIMKSLETIKSLLRMVVENGVGSSLRDDK